MAMRTPDDALLAACRRSDAAAAVEALEALEAAGGRAAVRRRLGAADERGWTALHEAAAAGGRPVPVGREAEVAAAPAERDDARDEAAAAVCGVLLAAGSPKRGACVYDEAKGKLVGARDDRLPMLGRFTCCTPLGLAVWADRPACVDALLAVGCLYFPVEPEYSAMTLAVLFSHGRMVRHFMSRCLAPGTPCAASMHPVVCGSNAPTALWLAVRLQRYDLLEVMLTPEYNWKSVGRPKYPCWVYIKETSFPDMALPVGLYGEADVAVELGDNKALAMLIAGASDGWREDLSENMSPDSVVPLARAAQHGNVEACRMLLEAGAEPRRRFLNYPSATQHARRLAPPEVRDEILAMMSEYPR